jgi:hypothetical protein
MGKGMVQNLVKKTRAEIVSVYDINPDNIEALLSVVTNEELKKIRVCHTVADVSLFIYPFLVISFSLCLSISLSVCLSLF